MLSDVGQATHLLELVTHPALCLPPLVITLGQSPLLWQKHLSIMLVILVWPHSHYRWGCFMSSQNLSLTATNGIIIGMPNISTFNWDIRQMKAMPQSNNWIWCPRQNRHHCLRLWSCSGQTTITCRPYDSTVFEILNMYMHTSMNSKKMASRPSCPRYNSTDSP